MAASYESWTDSGAVARTRFPRAAIAHAPVGAVMIMLNTATARMISPGPVSIPAARMASSGAEPMAA